jgi:hypothetical protein
VETVFFCLPYCLPLGLRHNNAPFMWPGTGHLDRAVIMRITSREFDKARSSASSTRLGFVPCRKRPEDGANAAASIRAAAPQAGCLQVNNATSRYRWMIVPRFFGQKAPAHHGIRQTLRAAFSFEICSKGIPAPALAV